MLNREILFRGQTRKRGEKVKLDGTPVDGNWVYGGILPGEGNYSVIYSRKSDSVEKYVVYSDTVGQYTGLDDKHGTKIFEGDIIKFVWRGNVVDVVIFDRGMFKAYGISLMTWLYPECRCEVIGNRWDNPELLREEDA